MIYYVKIMVLSHIDLKYVSQIYHKIHQKGPNGNGLNSGLSLQKISSRYQEMSLNMSIRSYCFDLWR